MSRQLVVFFILIVVASVVRGGEEAATPLMYQNQGTTMACVEINGPHAEPAKICGPMVSALPPLQQLQAFQQQMQSMNPPPPARAAPSNTDYMPYDRSYETKPQTLQSPQMRETADPCGDPSHMTDQKSRAMEDQRYLGRALESRTFPFAPLGFEEEQSSGRASAPGCIDSPMGSPGGVPVRGIPPRVIPRGPMRMESFYPKLRAAPPTMEQLLQECEERDKILQSRMEEIVRLKTQLQALQESANESSTPRTSPTSTEVPPKSKSTEQTQKQDTRTQTKRRA